jgi:hypothetical protein
VKLGAMGWARVRFWIFVVLVLGVPAVLMAAGDPRTTDLGKLALILGPAVFGLALNASVGNRRQSPANWGRVGVAAAVTLLVATGAVAAALALGGAQFQAIATSPGSVAQASAISALTSVLEELGWAAAGVPLAIRAHGRRWGVILLGLVWAAWHLAPVWFRVGLFPDLEAGPPAMIAAFAVSCVIYRELLTTLQDRAGTWLAAAAGHAAPNILLAGLMAAGLGGFGRGMGWMLFPAPGGLVFPMLALAAIVALRMRDRPAAETSNPRHEARL